MTEPLADTAQWLLAARDGSSEALGKALEACRRYLLSVARQELDPELQAKSSPSDLVQETFVEAQRDFTHFHGHTEAELLAWLRLLLMHRLGKLRRHYSNTQKRQIAREVSLQAGDSSGDLANGLMSATQTPSVQAMAHEQDAALQAALQRLPDDYRRVIIMRYQDEQSFEQIGQLTDRSPDAARKLWMRAIERLQLELEGK
jgi:RNA polymerase sigma-70 factor, ECF subfamily